MTISQIHVLFHVPEGFEEIATLDIKESLLPFEGLDPLSTIYISEAKTGRVHLFSKIHQEIEIKQWWDFLSNIALVCVYHMTLITTTTTIPIQDVYHDNKKIMDEQENQEEKEEDNVLGQYLQSKVKHTNWQAYLNHIQQDNNNEDTSSSAKATFRATFYKDQLTHSMKTQDISGWIGYAYSELYPLWKVNLKKYDYNIVGIWGKSKDQALLAHCLCKDETMDSSLKEGKEEEETRPILLYLGIEIPMPDPKYRNRVHLGRTSLNPPIASCLVRLADPQPGQIIFDMCCGTGTIPIEGASKYPNTLWVGGEVKVKTLSVKAKENMLHAKVSNVELLLSDGRLLNFRHGSIDTIVSDWPWGIREGSFSTIQKLYPKFIRQISHVLRKNGKAYIVSQGQKLMGRVLEYDWVKEIFLIEDILSISIGGIGVFIYILKKK